MKTVLSLFKSVDFVEMMRALVRSHPDAFGAADGFTQKEYEQRQRDVVCAYYCAYMDMINVNVGRIKNASIELKKVRNRDESWYDVYCMIDGDDYGIDFISWYQVLGFSLGKIPYELHSAELLAAEIIWEMTFYTYEINDFLIDGLEDDDEIVKNNLISERNKSYSECIELAHSIGGEMLTNLVTAA